MTEQACGEGLPGISLCMIVRDEERFLPGALESVRGVVDEICIVDTGSRDATIEIAERYGARVRSLPWNEDFAEARNAALAMARHRWVFVLDADERLTEDSQTELRRLGRGKAALRGWWIRCRNLSDDYKGSGAMSNALVRLFPNNPRIRYRNRIHEFVTLDDAAGGLPSDLSDVEILHQGYLAHVVAARAKAQRNLRLSQAAVDADPDDPFHQLNLGMAALLSRDEPQAIVALEAMRRLTAHSPRGFRPHGLVTLADLYARRNDFPSALRVVDEAIEATPTYPNAHFVRGKILAAAGQLYEARDAFGRAIASGEHAREQFVVDDEIAIWKAHSEIGATLMREQRFDEALAWFDLALQARPEAEPLLVNRARALEALARFDEARAAYEELYRIHAGEQAAVEYMNYLLRRGDARRALAIVDLSAPRMSDETAFVVVGTAAAVACALGDEARAAAYLEGAIRRVRPEAKAIAMLEELYASLLGGLAARSLLRRRAASRKIEGDDLFTTAEQSAHHGQRGSHRDARRDA